MNTKEPKQMTNQRLYQIIRGRLLKPGTYAVPAQATADGRPTMMRGGKYYMQPVLYTGRVSDPTEWPNTAAWHRDIDDRGEIRYEAVGVPVMIDSEYVKAAFPSMAEQVMGRAYTAEEKADLDKGHEIERAAYYINYAQDAFTEAVAMIATRLRRYADDMERDYLREPGVEFARLGKVGFRGVEPLRDAERIIHDIAWMMPNLNSDGLIGKAATLEAARAKYGPLLASPLPGKEEEVA